MAKPLKRKRKGPKSRPNSAEDETAYLLLSPANRERLLKAMENVAQGRNLEVIDLGDLA
jgi:hypothetical protein